MKILIDNHPLEMTEPRAKNFQEFCQKIMEKLLEKNRSIGTCEFDGVTVNTVEEANLLFQKSTVCKIESIPLAVAMEAALTAKYFEAQALEGRCDAMVTQALLAKPEEIAEHWHLICEEIKSLIGFLPRLSGLLTEPQIDNLIDRNLHDLSQIMNGISAAFNKGDTLEISDCIELKLLPWMKEFCEFFHTCLQLTKTLSR